MLNRTQKSANHSLHAQHPEPIWGSIFPKSAFGKRDSNAQARLFAEHAKADGRQQTVHSCPKSQGSIEMALCV